MTCSASRKTGERLNSYSYRPTCTSVDEPITENYEVLLRMFSLKFKRLKYFESNSYIELFAS